MIVFETAGIDLIQLFDLLDKLLLFFGRGLVISFNQVILVDGFEFLNFAHYMDAFGKDI